jgi:tripartite-type tricarboxylate transporter receptor subunit TctC
MPTRRAALSLATAPLAARAQSGFPDRPVRYIVPFTPAGLTDIMARLVAERLAAGWGRPVVVENRPGGNAMIGAEAAARAAPDGHTLLAITLTHAVNVGLFPNAPYDLLRDFSTISVLGSLPLVVCVNAASPARSLAELMVLARAKPLSGASSGNGSPPHLGLELFRRAAGLGETLVHAPYRGGAPAITDLVAGNIDMIVANLPECLAQLRAGRLRGLAVTSAERHRLVSEIQLEITNWTAVLTQAAVPAPIIAELSRATWVAMADPDLRRRAEDGGFDLLGWDAARSREFVTAEASRWSRLVAEAGIRPDA